MCKPCHTKVQHGHLSRVNSNDVEHSKNVVVMNSNDMTQSMEFHKTSPDFTQNPKYTNHCICTCCHKTDLPRSQCIIFKASRYNSDNTVLSNALSNCFVASTTKEFICKKCDKSLLAAKLPVDARCRLQNTKQKIYLYCKGISNKSILFYITEYRNNLLATQIHENSMLHHDSVICDRAILKESLLTCIICENTVAKKYFVGKYKYSSLKHTMPQITNIPNSRSHICKTCYLQLQQNFVCVFCRRNVEKHMCELYRKADLTFQTFLYHDV